MKAHMHEAMRWLAILGLTALAVAIFYAIVIAAILWLSPLTLQLETL